MGGETNRKQQHVTSQQDNRHLFENSFNHEYEAEFDYENSSRGNNYAGRDVFNYSEAAAEASWEAVKKAAEENTKAHEATTAVVVKTIEDSRRVAETAIEETANTATQVTESAADLMQRLAEEERRKAIAQAELEKERAEEETRRTLAALEETRRAAEIANQTAQAAIEESRRVAENSNSTAVALNNNTNATLSAAIAENRRVAESANETSLETAKAALASNENTVDAVTRLLEKDQIEDNALITSSFDVLSDKLTEASDSNTKALSQAFQSSVGGLAEQQQQILIYGFVALIVVGGIVVWRTSK